MKTLIKSIPLYVKVLILIILAIVALGVVFIFTHNPHYATCFGIAFMLFFALLGHLGDESDRAERENTTL